jgi:glycine/D-amino acid oxidase-like deaminating enzyme
MKADVIIIGGGVIGTACAYFLSLRGARILLLEHKHLGAGASGTTAAIVNIGGTGGPLEPLRALNLESYNLILDMEHHLERPMEIVRGGSLQVALNDQEASETHAIYQEACQSGLKCDWLEASQVRRIEPMLGPHVAAAFYNPASYHLNPFRLYDGYLDQALRRGGKIEYGVRVLKLETKNNKISRVITSNGDYHADWVVVAAGVHSPEIISSIGIKLPIVPARGQVILTEPCSVKTKHLMLFSGHLYIKQTLSGNFYLGSHTEFVGFDQRITLEKITDYIRVYAKAVPLLTRLRALRFFAGFRPFCEDNLPVIGPVPNCSRLIVASGHGKTGVRYSASTGKAVSEVILDGETEHPIDAFSMDRFDKH